MSNTPHRWLSFDPTIHAGHVLTAVTIAVSAIGIWFGMQNDISQLKLADKAHDARFSTIEEHATADRRETDRKFEGMVRENNQALTKLRDDMQGWFMVLGDKLDRKADKR
ncbi:hypothetical protein J8F10_08820 [Gemmata sp. G18]|uniref:Uncharacterized protein n=1 Tax=Gemmata palustris TaxID=2822762 RepID=A0ABS5BNT7_9BACT|nr:hypothetical protein [Gemmata palustris]MBP3955381.1 hypothetical protein [Gemmata palustris]